jgi:translation initiation factor 1 (eIF-1/SUI1)
MAKKEKPPLEAAPLKYSPFAALRDQGVSAPSVPSAREADARGATPNASAPDPAHSAPLVQAAAVPTRAPKGVSPASAAPSAGKSRGRLLQRRETKHRAGKAVIIVSGFEELRDFDEAALAALAKELKQALGCGGTLEMRAGKRELVLQGDRAAQVAALLCARGFRVDGVTS